MLICSPEAIWTFNTQLGEKWDGHSQEEERPLPRNAAKCVFSLGRQSHTRPPGSSQSLGSPGARFSTRDPRAQHLRKEREGLGVVLSHRELPSSSSAGWWQVSD